MPNSRQVGGTAVIFMALSILGLGSILLTSTWKECIDAYRDNYLGNEIKGIAPGFIEMLRASFGCMLSAIGEYFEAITALATIAVATFTCALWWSTHRLWVASDQQIKLARQEFVATFRPKLVVRHVHIPDDKAAKTIKVAYLVVNSGGSVANVFEGRASIGFYKRLPSLPLFERPNEIKPLVLESGESCEMLYEISANDTDWFSYFGAVNKEVEEISLYFYGLMKYKDATATTVREIGFCFKYDGHRFETVRHVDYGYSD